MKEQIQYILCTFGGAILVVLNECIAVVCFSCQCSTILFLLTKVLFTKRLLLY